MKAVTLNGPAFSSLEASYLSTITLPKDRERERERKRERTRGRERETCPPNYWCKGYLAWVVVTLVNATST